MALRTPDAIVGPFRQRDTIILTAVLRDEFGIGIPGPNLDTAELTLYNEVDPYDIINARDGVDITANIDAAGVFSFELSPDDMDIVDEDELTEKHRALIEWTYDGGKRGSAEVQILVRNVLKVD
jgi:hypothetical protein